ncbi:uncharacterized protein ACA1_113970 [Acanthamoeba castellanii str. Neff]|uniref:AIG1-type G domain-containing protein n=1 Tax=Acanthamoeba castellanii (strain ATCC 30010 / Neff) TaxID=1257118 RepID=L8H4E7_ACACF|nr:uncharacterized protein ACA1_113970 [Acanthamoeba castellanii str. Neff]ELR20050.1 hypothetical protein ACA1_113970 [Acanthamoeba castellanii str. Neff]
MECIMQQDKQQLPLHEVQLCLVGKTSTGKSTLGNLLCLGANFKTSAGVASVMSMAEQAHIEYLVHSILLVLLNMMGLGDMAHQPELVQPKITEGIISLVGGIDFFFLCIKKEHFTEENYLIVMYLFRAILRDQLLGNLWLVVTHTEDLANNTQAQAQWLHDVCNNKMFDHVLRMVGAQKVLFINNRSLKNKQMDKMYTKGHELAKDLLLQVMQSNKLVQFTIESLEAAQKEYDDMKAAAEGERAAEVARLRQVEIDAVMALEKEKARLAIQEAELQAELQAELKLVTARAELEAKLRGEAEERLRNAPTPQQLITKGGGCVLF